MSERRDWLMLRALKRIKSPTMVWTEGNGLELFVDAEDMPDKFKDQLSVIAQTKGLVAAKAFLSRSAWASNEFEFNFSGKKKK